MRSFGLAPISIDMETAALGENMSSATMVTRDHLAIAAAHVAGEREPLPETTPRAGRTYLYGTPSIEGHASFPVETLAGRLADSGLQVGIDRDKESETYGLRFVLRSEKMPADIAPFAGQEAKKEWSSWRARQKEMAEKVSEAAAALGRGEDILFSRDDLEDQNTRGRNGRKSSERE